jgi:hypothetical protein
MWPIDEFIRSIQCMQDVADQRNRPTITFPNAKARAFTGVVEVFSSPRVECLQIIESLGRKWPTQQHEVCLPIRLHDEADTTETPIGTVARRAFRRRMDAILRPRIPTTSEFAFSGFLGLILRYTVIDESLHLPHLACGQIRTSDSVR